MNEKNEPVNAMLADIMQSALKGWQRGEANDAIDNLISINETVSEALEKVIESTVRICALCGIYDIREIKREVVRLMMNAFNENAGNTNLPLALHLTDDYYEILKSEGKIK